MNSPGELDSVTALCRRHREMEHRQNDLHKRLGELETMLVDRHNWHQLTRMQRRRLPAAGPFYDLEDELERLDREGAALVDGLQRSPSTSLLETVLKLEVVSQVIEPDDYPDAHAVLTGAIEELRSLSQK